jgi:hypothetical protein
MAAPTLNDPLPGLATLLSVGRVHPAVVLKYVVASILGLLATAVLIGETWLVIGSFGLLLLTLRSQRRQEMKRLHGYHRKKRRRSKRRAAARTEASESG